MAIELYANDATSTLAGAINNTALTANLASGGGALFPHPIAGQYFTMTFNDASTGLLDEIVWVTNVTGDTVTMVRGQEGTIAQNWSAGDIASNFITAGGLQQFVQIPQAQAQSYNAAQDTGVANAYAATLNPVLSAHVPFMPIWFKALNANTTASTFNPGPGTLPIVNPDGTSLGSATFVPGGLYCLMNDGAGHYQLISTSNEALSSQGIATTGDMKFRPTSESIPGWIVANATTIGNATSGASQRANPDTFNNFSWHWTNFSNTQCPVLPSGRGANPAADFAANKTIQVLDWRGVGPQGVDTMGGAASTTLVNVPVTSGSRTVPGSVLGENLHALVTAELAAHAHANTLNDPGHLHAFDKAQAAGASGASGSVLGVNVVANTSSATTGMSINNISAGSGTAHNTVALSMLVTWYIKL